MPRLTAGDPEWVGPYRVVTRLGTGGMGIVYLGTSLGGRQVAVKVLRPELSQDSAFRRRFAREVASARAVSGVFTAGVVDADPEGSPAWLATAYVSGLSLGEAVAKHGPLPEASALALAAGLTEAIGSIHRAGVIHRDLKPSNVLLAEDGPRVIDFGISKVQGSSLLTQGNQVFGTPGFMSPEQLQGRPVGSPSDVFSLGAVAVFAATGHGPFGAGASPELGYRTVHEQPDVTGVPTCLVHIVERCLAKDPRERPTVALLLAELAELNGSTQEVTEVFTGTGWLPEALAHTLRPQAYSLQVNRSSGSELRSPDPESDGSVLDRGDDSPRRSPETPSSAAVSGGGSRMSRRRALFGLACVGAAGAGLAGWTLLSDDFRPGRQRWRFATDGAILGTPTEANGLVYAVSKDNTLYAVDANSGRKKWAFSARADRYPSPAVANGILYLSDEDPRGRVYALRAATGEHLWDSPLILSRALIAGGFACLVTGQTITKNGKAYSMLEVKDAATGDQHWKFRVDDSAFVAVAAESGTVFVAGAKNLYALDAATGEQTWSAPVGGLAGLTVRAVRGTVFVHSSRGLYAVEASTGQVRWEFTHPGMMDSFGVTTSGHVYAFTKESDAAAALHALDFASGIQKWQYTINDETGGDINPPIITRDMVYVSGAEEHGRKGSTLRALHPRKGQEEWIFTHDGSMTLQPTVTANVVYLGSGDTHLYALDGRTGQQQWKFRTRGNVTPPFVSDGVAYAGSGDGNLYAVTV